jgi:hypothetical protein
MNEPKVGMWWKHNTQENTVRPILVTRVTPSRMSFRDPPDNPKIAWDSRLSGLMGLFPTEADAWLALIAWHERQIAYHTKKAEEHRTGAHVGRAALAKATAPGPRACQGHEFVAASDCDLIEVCKHCGEERA